MTTATSIESRASMAPSTVLAPRQRLDRAYCRMCTCVREMSHEVHPILGRLCVWCAEASDYSVTKIGIPVQPSDHCLLCQDGECDFHDSTSS